MTDAATNAEGRRGSRFEYFMIRVHRAVDAPGEISGQIERLGSGERRTFTTGEHLLRLVATWRGPNRPRTP